MRNVERLSITLPTEMAHWVRAKVKAGSYASNSEVIRAAIRIWQEQLRAERLAGIRAKIAEADADPRPSVDDEDVETHR